MHRGGEIRESGRERESVDVPWKKDYKMYDSSAQADGATKKKTNEKRQHEDYTGPLRPTFYITPPLCARIRLILRALRYKNLCKMDPEYF